MKAKGEFFIDCLSDDEQFSSEDYGVFYTHDDEYGKSGHCYYYGSKEQAQQYADQRNKNLGR